MPCGGDQVVGSNPEPAFGRLSRDHSATDLHSHSDRCQSEENLSVANDRKAFTHSSHRQAATDNNCSNSDAWNINQKVNMKLLRPNEEQLEKIMSELSQDTMDQLKADAKVLKLWLNQQPHLPHYMDEDILTSFLCGCKGSVERAKAKLDGYLTARGEVPELYGNRDPCGPEIRNGSKTVKFFPLPKMTKEGYRVDVAVLVPNTSLSDFSFVSFCKRVLATADMRLQYESVWAGEVVIFDVKGLTLSHLTKVMPSMVKKFVYCGQDAIPSRPKGLYFINVPHFQELLVNMFKPLLKEKIAKRLHVFSGDHTELYKYIDKEILPQEYGGQAESIDELNKSWQNLLEENRDWFLNEGSHKAEEHKRPPKSLYKPTHLFGIEGTFKKLSID